MTRWTTFALSALLGLVAGGVAPATAGRIIANDVLGEWRRFEGYVVLVETAPLGAPSARRELVFISKIYAGQIPTPDFLVLVVDIASGNVSSAYKVSMQEAARRPEAVTPIATLLDANSQALRIQDDGPIEEIGPLELSSYLRNVTPVETVASQPDSRPAPSSLRASFVALRVPSTTFHTLLPLWLPALNAGIPIQGAEGLIYSVCAPGAAQRIVTQSARRTGDGDWVFNFRACDGGAPLYATLQTSKQFPLPLWGQVIDSGRRERTRFRLLGHSPRMTRALSIGRGALAGDPLLIAPERLENAESEWYEGFVDLPAAELAQKFASERGWAPIKTRRTPTVGEAVPFAYELFAVQPPVRTGVTAKPAPSPSRSNIAPRGVIGLTFVGRFEDPATNIRYEAWCIPGSDERVVETDSANPVGESPGKLLLRLTLGNAAARNSDREINFRRDPGWFAKAKERMARDALASIFTVAGKGGGKKNGKKPQPAAEMPAVIRRGTDTLFIRRESDLSPVSLMMYRMSEDLRTVVPFVETDLNKHGSSSIIRRSLLERAKDFFLAGGFTAFTTSKKGATLLLTRSNEDGTTVDLLDRTGAVEFLEERSLPEEPWKLAMDPKGPRQGLWGTPVSLWIGRNKYGDARAHRDGIVRRTDGEELLVYESWEVDRPWWSEAIAAYPTQGVGARFRPLVHAKLPSIENSENNNNDNNDILPFEPPPPPPQPRGNPRTPRADPKPPKAKPKDPGDGKKVPPPPPPIPTGPKTGG